MSPCSTDWFLKPSLPTYSDTVERTRRRGRSQDDLSLVGVSYGTLDEAARRARGVGADIVVRPPGASVIAAGSSPISDGLLPFFMKQPHVTFATTPPVRHNEGHKGPQ